MNGQVQMAGLNLLFDALFQLFCVAHNAEQTLSRQVVMHQGFSLIALKFSGIIRVPLEITALQQRSVDFVQIGWIRIKPCPLVVGVAVGKKIF